MHARNVAVTLALALTVTLTAPAALADGWLGGAGRAEPNTPYDASPFMFQEPNDRVEDRIYFNGIAVRDAFPSVTPLTDGSTVIVEDRFTFAALLGYWRDCNRDGYIGAKNVPTAYGNWGAGAYPGDVYGHDPDVCPRGSAYNDGAFVDEFRWIGPGAASASDAACVADATAACVRVGPDAADVTDDDAVVWADLGFPDGVAFHTGPLFIRGMFNDSSSGIDRVDRMFGGFVAGPVNEYLGPRTWDTKPTVGACDEGERRFMEGPANQCGLYPLWQVKRLVNDSDAHDEDATPLVRVFDTEDDDDRSGSACDDTKLPTGHEMADVHPRATADPIMDGSLGGTLVDAFRGTGNGAFDGTCGSWSAPNLEGDESPTPGKAHADVRLRFHPDARASAPFLGVHDVPTDGLGLTGGVTSLGDPGVGPFRGGARWIGDTVILRHTGGALTTPRPATLYADVSNDAFENAGAYPWSALPARAQNAHEYGRPACNGDYADTPENRAPNALGWVCSSAYWERDERLGVGAGVIIGRAFDLRDVDCYDFGLTEDAELPRVVMPATPLSDARVVRESCAALME